MYKKGLILFLLLFGYAAIILYYIHFIQVLIKMKQEVLLPITDEEMNSIRKEPQKEIKAATYSRQKKLLSFIFLLLLCIIAMFIVIWSFHLHTATYHLILYPIFYSTNLLILFTFTKDGVMFVLYHGIELNSMSSGELM